MDRTEPRAPSRLKGALVGLATVAILGALFWQLDVTALGAALGGADLGLVLLACGIALFFNTVQSAEVLRHTLSGLGVQVPFRAALAATVGNLAIHAILPAGTGNVGRVAFLVRTEGTDIARTSLAAVTLLWMKLVWLWVLAFAGWLALADAPAWQGPLVSAGLGVAILLTLVWTRAGRWLGTRTWLPSKIAGMGETLADALGDLSLRGLALGALHALIAVSVELLVFSILLFALGGPWVPAQVLAYLPLVVIGAKVPLTLMGLGTREALVVVLFSAAPAETMLAAALLFSGAEHVLSALVGTLVTHRFLGRIAD